VFSAISDSAAAGAAQVVGDVDHPQAPRLGREPLGIAGCRHEGIKVEREAPVDAGSQHLHRDRLRSVG
jgi:hypothetical protein